MKNFLRGQAKRSPAAGEAWGFKLPLVSVVITTHNYAHFLRQAVDCVLAQSYREIECVIVDDGSTDETPKVAAEAVRRSRAIKSLRNEKALGQGGASRVGFEASRGQYIVFLDGDDILEPDFVRDHIYVNLSSRRAIGLTSSDIYQVVDGRIVTAAGEALNSHLRATAAEGAGLAFRPLSSAPGGPWPYSGPGEALLGGVRYAPPGLAAWIWSPMTANMFRRDALSLFIGAPQFEQLRSGTDVYLCMGVSLLSGSLLIDKALSWYRIHGANAGTYQAQLTNIRTLRPENELSWRAKQLLVEHLTAHAKDLVDRMWHPHPLLFALQSLNSALGGGGRDSYMANCMERHRDALVALLGEDSFNRMVETGAAH